MKAMIRYMIAFASLCAAVAPAAFGATPPPNATVVYAFVPKERLSDAVRGPREALEIEAAWRKEAQAKAGPPPYPINVGSTKYSIVVFVEVATGFALWGRIGIPVQHAEDLRIVNVNLAPGYSGTYVMDGGGLILTRGIPPDPKPYEWLEFRTSK